MATMRARIFGVTITARPSGQHLDRFEVAQVGVGPHVHLLAGLLFDDRGLGHFADREVGREARVEALGVPAGGDDRLALVDVLVESMKSRISSPGLPTSALTTPWTPSGTTLAATALEWSEIRVTWEEPPVTAVTLPTSPSPLITGSSTGDPVAAADVDRHGGVPDRRRARDHLAGHRLVAGGDDGAVESDQLAQLRVLGERRLARDGLLAGVLQFCLEPAVAAARVEGLVEPVDQVAGGLQRPVGDPCSGLKMVLTPRCRPSEPCP